MAKDINLTSEKWIDLIFEGRNKNYGAYTLRKNSPRCSCCCCFNRDGIRRDFSIQ